jgi:hypothetical protein
MQMHQNELLGMQITPRPLILGKADGGEGATIVFTGQHAESYVRAEDTPEREREHEERALQWLGDKLGNRGG